MKIKSSMINRGLRNTGRIIKIINSTFTESRLRLMYKLSRKSKIRVKDDTMQLLEEWVTRIDGSKIRLCIC